MVGQELKKLRQRLGLSVAEAARQVAVAGRSWYRWENGSRKMPEGALKLFKLINKQK